MSKNINRRKFLHMSAAGVAGLVITSCAPATTAPVAAPTAQVIEKQVEVTRVVEKEGKTEIQVVTATPEPVKKVEAEAVLGVLPRSETFITDSLTGRVGTPSNFMEWQGWHNRDRGTQQLANEPLWSVDFATGKIIPGLADGDPVYNADFTEVTFPLRKGVAWDDGQPFTPPHLFYPTVPNRPIKKITPTK